VGESADTEGLPGTSWMAPSVADIRTAPRVAREPRVARLATRWVGRLVARIRMEVLVWAVAAARLNNRTQGRLMLGSIWAESLLPPC
jgi:hypothetical protein